ncbi:MAG: hypothetical protein ACO215_11750, partial [Vulcanococcus sp.]
SCPEASGGRVVGGLRLQSELWQNLAAALSACWIVFAAWRRLPLEHVFFRFGKFHGIGWLLDGCSTVAR